MKHLIDNKVGESVDLFYLIKQSITGVTTQGSPFMTIISQDKVGYRSFKLWDTKKEQVNL